MSIREIDAKSVELIEKHGYTVIAVFPDFVSDTPSFAYTIGLEKTAKHPEICMVGLPTDVLMQLVQDAGKQIIGGRKFDVDERIDKVIMGFDMVAKDAPQQDLDAIFVRASVYYGGIAGFRMRQLFWPDAEGLFPWEAGCDERFKSIQCQMLNFNFSAPNPGVKL